ncbi:hypothetical protein ACWKWU_13595 [Chitinophaga lutea]
MTLIIGYIYNGAVHIVADSVETILLEGAPNVILPEEFSSTMIESSIVKDGQLMIESACKIYNIRDRLILAFAGQVSEGHRMINQLIDGLVRTTDMREYVSSFFENERPAETQYIVGFMENGTPCMYCYHSSSRTFKMASNLSICNIGKNSWIPPEVFVTMLRTASERSHSQDDLLITAISTMQMITLGLMTLEQGVGGFINGVFFDRNGIHWAKDCIYILYNSIRLNAPESTYIVGKYNRDNAIFIRTNKQQRLFKTELELHGEEVEEKWGKKIESLANSGVADYYILLSYDKNVIFLVNNKSHNSCKVFVEDGKFTFSRDLVEANTTAHKKRGNSIEPFILASNFP